MSKGMSNEFEDGAGFEPSKYLASLIDTINDGAKLAQSGMLLLLLVGVYLLATAFSASDEDLLLGRTVTISQIGASLPVSFSFAIAPLVFVFLHIYALTRYDMLGTNTRFFLAEMHSTVSCGADRERCQQLLANVEFVQALTAMRQSSLYSRIWPILSLALMAAFPVVVLLLVQINSLRYQSGIINWIQRFWLLIDVLGIALFFIRNPLNGRALGRESRFGFVIHWVALFGLPLLIGALNVAWLNVVPAEMDPEIVHFDSQQWMDGHQGKSPTWLDEFEQPLELLLCPRLKWGCRYLRVEHRTLVDHVWDGKAMSALRTEGVDYAAALAGIEGVVLRGRSLRFAVLDDSRLYAADLTSADLRNASLIGAQLQSAKFVSTQLDGASLIDAQLQGASFEIAEVRGASLDRAQLQGADLANSELIGTTLDFVQAQGADLGAARLMGASFEGANLQGADFGGARLQGASLDGAQLQGVSFDHAALRGASLDNVFVWRAGGQITLESDASGFKLQNIITEARRRCEWFEAKTADGHCDWSKVSFEALKLEVSNARSIGTSRQWALFNIEPMLNPDVVRAGDRAIADLWLRRQAHDPPIAQFEEEHAKAWQQAGCSALGSPFVVAKLSDRLIDFLGDRNPHAVQLAAAFLDSRNCAGARGISARTRATLEELAKPPVPSAATALQPPRHNTLSPVSMPADLQHVK